MLNLQLCEQLTDESFIILLTKYVTGLFGITDEKHVKAL